MAMRISRRTLILSLLSGVFILCIFAAVYLLSSQSSSGSAPPEEMPAAAEPTVSEFPAEATEAVAGTTAQPSLPERRRLTVEFPPRIRSGDSDLVRLTLEVDGLGNLTPTAESDGHVVTGEVVEIPNLYESHHVIVEARFDLAGAEVRPAELVSEALSPGHSVIFRWSVRPEEVGIYRGTIWLYLRFVDKLTGAKSQKTLSAQIIEIEAVNFLGLSGDLARTTGVVGSVVGTLIGFPFLEDMIKWMLKRRIKPR